VPRHSVHDYPANWFEIAEKVKAEAGWKCIRCGHPHEPATGYCLTVHHLDYDPSNNIWWNLLALCQRCHLHIGAKVVVEQEWMFEHSAWFKPYVAGYYARLLGLPEDREAVEPFADAIIQLAQWRTVTGKLEAIA
jgi:hypothetical protein